MSTKQKFCEHCRDFVYTITYRQHLVHNCAVLLPPPTKKCKHCQDFVYTRTYRQHLVHNCAVLLPLCKKIQIWWGQEPSPFHSVPLCFRSCSCPLQGGVSYSRLNCIFHVVMVHSALHVHITVLHQLLSILKCEYLQMHNSFKIIKLSVVQVHVRMSLMCSTLDEWSAQLVHTSNITSSVLWGKSASMVILS